MIKRIRQLEKISSNLEPDEQTFRQWNEEVFQYCYAFLNKMKAGSPTYIQKLPPDFEGNWTEIKEEAGNIKSLLAFTQRFIDQTGINPAAPAHFGYVPGGGLVPGAMGDYIAAITNRYAGLFFANPGAVKLENDLIRWMCRLMGFPDTALGNLTSGGSMANLIAVTTARESRQIRPENIEKLTVYLSKQTHHCAQKALRIAGMAEAKIRYIPLDNHFRMDPQALKHQIEKDKKKGFLPFMVVGSAGTTDTGAVDPLDDLANICQNHHLWYHIDAAYGGFFIMVDELKSLFKGIERADSITIDPHKGLFLPYGSGAVLIKDVQSQYKAHYYPGNYMQDSLANTGEPNPCDLSPELTKHFKGLRMWFPLYLFGLKTFKAALEEKLYLCRYFYNKIRQLGFETGPYPDLSIMIFRYKPAQENANVFNTKLLDAIHKDGRIFLSSTTIEGIFWIRFAVICFRSHLKQVDLALTIIQEKLSTLKSIALT